MTRDIALKIVFAATLIVGCASLAVVAAKQQWKCNKPCEIYSVTAIEEKPVRAGGIENVALQDNNHFVIIFAYDGKGVLRKPATSHVFAMFYETAEGGVCKPPFGISWGQVGSQLKPGVCNGKNFQVKDTLEYATKNDLEVQMFGPYAIDEKFFKNAVLRHKDLESGKYYYRIWDSQNRINLDRPAVNNVHAVSDIAGCIETEGKYGREAAQKIVDKFEKNAIVSQQNNGRDTCHDQVLKELNLSVRPMSGRRR
jgi:hypothetical protein